MGAGLGTRLSSEYMTMSVMEAIHVMPVTLKQGIWALLAKIFLATVPRFIVAPVYGDRLTEVQCIKHFIPS